MKKAKEVNTLFNFNAHDNNDKSKNKKKNKVSKKSKALKSKNNKKDNSHTEQISTFDFSNEIVIGLTKIDDEKKSKKKNDKTSKISKKNSKNKKNEVKKKSNKSLLKSNKNTIDKKEKGLERLNNNKQKNKSRFGRKLNKKKNNLIVLDNQNEQDLIFDLQDDSIEIQNKKTSNKKHKKTLNNKKIKKNNTMIKIVSVTAIFIIAIVASMMSPLFNIKEIIVEGNRKISSEQIVSLSQIEIEENLYRINTRRAKKSILENPYIQAVIIKRKLPDKIVIIVDERKPTFMIEDGSGYAYINNQGYVLEISDEKLELPIIQGAETEIDQIQPGKRLCVADLNKLTTVIKIMEIAENNEINSLITRIDIENKQNYKILFETEQKVANLGDDSDLNTKILTIKSILDKEKDVAGEIFVNMDLNTSYPTFRQNV